jgi:hypothetical protein
MEKAEFIRRAVKEHEQRFGFKEQQLGYFLYIIECAMHFGKRRLADDVDKQLGSFVADLYRPTEKLIAPGENAPAAQWAKLLHEGDLEDEWRAAS